MIGPLGVAMFRMPVLSALALLLAAAPGATFAQQSKSTAEKEKARINELRAQVRSYRCRTKAGRKYYGSTIPQQCTGELIEALSAQGTLLFRIDPPLTPEQRAAKQAEEEKAAAAEQAKHDAQAAALVQTRRDQALLQTYTSEKDIESVRQRAIEDNRKASQQVEKRIAALRQRQEKLAKQPGKSPEQLEQDRRAIAYDLTLQEQLLESRRREAVAINAKYDEQKRKYLKLTKGSR